MAFWKQYSSPLGYANNGNQIDSYGVDHSGFSTQDEVQYQTARVNRENELMSQMNSQGVTDYPQYGTNFWGNSADNNYGFGTSNITNNIENIKSSMSPMSQMTAQPSTSQAPQPTVWSDQAKRDAENSLLMSGLDTLYGANRTINGATFGGLDWLGNKLGIDTQMNEYLKLKASQGLEDTARTAGQIDEYGGGILTFNLGRAAYEPTQMMYNGYKIGKAYNKLSNNPFQGSGSDVIATMKNHAGEPVVLQRGEAMLGNNGEVIVHGKPLGRETGTVQNYGLDKIIYRHGMPKDEVTQIPKYLKQQPVETNAYGQNMYVVQGPNGKIRLITSPTPTGSTVASMYHL